MYLFVRIMLMLCNLQHVLLIRTDVLRFPAIRSSSLRSCGSILSHSVHQNGALVAALLVRYASARQAVRCTNLSRLDHDERNDVRSVKLRGSLITAT